MSLGLDPSLFQPLPGTLNPLTPSAYLPPTVAKANELFQDLLVGSFAVLIWDIIHSLPDEYFLITRTKFTFNTFIYFTMRLTILASWIIGCINFIGKTDFCGLLGAIGTTASGINLFCVHYMFLIRVCAVYPRNRPVHVFFGLLAAACVGWGLSLSPAAVPIPLGPTRHCLLAPDPAQGPQLLGNTLIRVIFDALVGIAITYKLAATSYSENHPSGREKRRWWLPKSLYLDLQGRYTRDSQWFFVFTAAIKIPQIILLLVFMGTKSLRGLSTVTSSLAAPDFCLINILLSRIYRSLKLGKPGLLDANKNIAPATNPGHCSHIHFQSIELGSVPDLASGRRRSGEVEVGSAHV